MNFDIHKIYKDGDPTTTILELPKPNACPHCGTSNDSSLISKQSVPYDNGNYVYVVVFKATCCKQIFLCTYMKHSNSVRAKCLYIYPQHIGLPLPKNIIDFSPRFVEMHRQASFAEQHNCIDLAGTGYRNAMEILVKDYAINILHEDSSEVCKKSLAKCIDDYMPSRRTRVASDIVRILGNDYTHYETKYNEADFPMLKVYFEMFVKAVEAELLIESPLIQPKVSANPPRQS